MIYSKTIYWMASMSLSAYMLANNAMAQTERTGSHLESSTNPTYIVQLNDPDEIKNIRQLLTDGRDQDALEAARQYIKDVEQNMPIQETLPRYYAYNALCTVYINLGQAEDALNACDEAISLEPEKWSALNNKGTAHLIAGQYIEALEVFQLALIKAPDENQAITETIEHNINLTNERNQKSLQDEK